MKYLILLFFSFIISACQPPDSKSSSPQNSTPQGSVDPIYGSWRYTIPGTSTSNSLKYIVAIIDSNKITHIVAYSMNDGATAKIYFRRYEGTYQRSGNKFDVNYSYETCNPVGKETLLIIASGSTNNNLVLSNEDSSLILMFARITPTDTSQLTASLIEDKNCDIIAKIQKKSSRSIASEKAKSFLEMLSFN